MPEGNSQTSSFPPQDMPLASALPLYFLYLGEEGGCESLEAWASLLSSSAVGKAGFVPRFRDLSITSSLLCHFDKPSDFLPTQGFERALLWMQLSLMHLKISAFKKKKTTNRPYLYHTHNKKKGR